MAPCQKQTITPIKLL